MTATPAERKALKAQAHALNPIVMIGNDGLTDAVLREIDRALSHHELIKIRVLGDDRAARAQMLTALCAQLNATPVQHIGKILVIHRENPELHEAPALPKPARVTRKTTRLADSGEPADQRARARQVDKRVASPRQSPRRQSQKTASAGRRTKRSFQR